VDTECTTPRSFANGVRLELDRQTCEAAGARSGLCFSCATALSTRATPGSKHASPAFPTFPQSRDELHLCDSLLSMCNNCGHLQLVHCDRSRLVQVSCSCPPAVCPSATPAAIMQLRSQQNLDLSARLHTLHTRDR
jgi:hypothetical protein